MTETAPNKRAVADKIFLIYRLNYFLLPFSVSIALLAHLYPGLIMSSLQWMLHLLLSVAVLFLRNCPQRNGHVLWLSCASLVTFATVVLLNVAPSTLSCIFALMTLAAGLIIIGIYPTNVGAVYSIAVMNQRKPQVLGCSEHQKEFAPQRTVTTVPRWQLMLVSLVVTILAAGSLAVGIIRVVADQYEAMYNAPVNSQPHSEKPPKFVPITIGY